MAHSHHLRFLDHWSHRRLTLDDGREVYWTVIADPECPPPFIAVVWVDGRSVWAPEGRDLLRAAGHPDGDLRAHHDPEP